MANRGQTSPFIKNFKSKRRAIINNLASNPASSSTNLKNHTSANASKKPKLDLHPKTKYKRNLADLSSARNYCQIFRLQFVFEPSYELANLFTRDVVTSKCKTCTKVVEITVCK